MAPMVGQRTRPCLVPNVTHSVGGLPGRRPAPVAVERPAEFSEPVGGLVVEGGRSLRVAFGLPEHATCLPYGRMPHAARPHPRDRLSGLEPAPGLVEAAGASV